MRKPLLLLLIIAMIGFGCRFFRNPSGAQAGGNDGSGFWVNPVIEFIHHPLVESIDRQGETPEENGGGSSGLVGFLQRKNEMFSSSGISPEEALRVYQALFKAGMIKNESVEMPDPDNPVPDESLEEFKSRVAIKSNPAGGFYVFFRKSGCGFTYFFGTFALDPATGAIAIQPVEVWRTKVPC
ncbi:MAG TPA: hypothetical protein VLH61_10890 [Bacteroidales bacterium]|nr:hypothetical protein [Bacteroidales bacterium]